MPSGSRRLRGNSRLVQVSPDTFIGRREGETDADVRKRYRREQELEQRVLEASRAVERFDNRARTGDRFTEGVADMGLAIPRELARRRYLRAQEALREARGYKKGGKVKKMAKGGKVNCRRGDGICRQGRTRGKMR